MKKALTASILLNLVLLVCLFALLRQPASDLSQTEAPSEVAFASNEPTVFTSKELQPDHELPVPSQFSQPTEISSPHRLQERPVTMPLVFQEVDLSQLNLNSDQLQAINDLRQRFLEEIGGLEQNPSDPSYCERWLKSQPQIDDDLRGMIGLTAFQDYQVHAANPLEKSH